MACLDPGEAVEVTGLVLPVRLREVTLALEEIVPRLVNADAGAGDCSALAAIADRVESCAYEQTPVESVPEPDSPIMGFVDGDSPAAVFDSWLAKGTLLGTDGSYSVFVVFMDVMRRPLQGSWTVQNMTVLGTKQPAASFLEELETDAVLARV